MSSTNISTAQKDFSLSMKNCSLLCSILVIFIHSYNIIVYNISDSSCVYWLEEVLSQCVARGAVPFFFVSSAFFLYQNEKSVISVYKSRFNSILLPYLLWNIIYMFLFTILNKLSLGDAGMKTINIANILKGVFLYKYNYTYWFMFYLIIFTLLYPAIKLLICKNKLVCFFVLISLLALNLFNVVPFNLTEDFIYYYIGAILGFYYKDNIAKLPTIKTRHKFLIMAVLVLFIAGLFTASKIYELNIFLIQNIMMVLLLFFIASFTKLKIPSFLLGLSFMIYSMHPIILETIEKIIFIFCPHNELWAFVDYIFAPTFTVVIITGACLLFKKMFPSLYAILNGNRK